MARSVLHFSCIFNSVLLVTVILSTTNFIECAQRKKIPEYIHLCKKNDVNLSQCVIQTFESLRPSFETGVPELGIPTLDPLFLPQIVIFNGEKGEIKVIANNVKAVGVKHMKIQSMNVNLDKLELKARVYFPHIHFEGNYDVNAKFVNFPVKGKGPLRGNATQVTADAVLKGKLETIEGVKYLEMDSAEVHVSMKGYDIKVDKLFPDKKLNEAINKIMNDPKVVPISMVKPLMDKVAARMLIDMTNKISKNIAFDDLFSS